MLKRSFCLTLSIVAAFAFVPAAQAGGTGQFNDRHVIGGMKGAKIYCGRGRCRTLSHTAQAKYAR